MAAPHVEFYTTDVPTATTAVQIANTSRKVLKVWVKPHEGNAGITYFGDSAVAAAKGWSMSNVVDAVPHLFDFTKDPPFAVYHLPLQSDFYVDAATSADKVDTVFLLE